VALGQVFSEYFGFPCQSLFHQLLQNHPHLSSGAGTIGQKWPQYKGLSPTPLEIKNVDPLLGNDREISSYKTAFANYVTACPLCHKEGTKYIFEVTRLGAPGGGEAVLKEI
jgi:hypothetical protein